MHKSEQPRPTIEELEKILHSEEKYLVTIMPDGSVSAEGPENAEGDCERSASDNVKCGPYRESAQSILKNKIRYLDSRLTSMRALLLLIGDEVGTPAETAVWEILNGDFRRM